MNKFIIISSIIAIGLTQASAITLTGDHKKIDDINRSHYKKMGETIERMATSKKYGDAQISYFENCSSLSKSLSDTKTCQATAIKQNEYMLKFAQELKAKAAKFEQIFTDTIKELKALEISPPVVKK